MAGPLLTSKFSVGHLPTLTGALIYGEAASHAAGQHLIVSATTYTVPCNDAGPLPPFLRTPHVQIRFMMPGSTTLSNFFPDAHMDLGCTLPECNVDPAHLPACVAAEWVAMQNEYKALFAGKYSFVKDVSYTAAEHERNSGTKTEYHFAVYAPSPTEVLVSLTLYSEMIVARINPAAVCKTDGDFMRLCSMNTPAGRAKRTEHMLVLESLARAPAYVVDEARRLELRESFAQVTGVLPMVNTFIAEMLRPMVNFYAKQALRFRGMYFWRRTVTSNEELANLMYADQRMALTVKSAAAAENNKSSSGAHVDKAAALTSLERASLALHVAASHYIQDIRRATLTSLDTAEDRGRGPHSRAGHIQHPLATMKRCLLDGECRLPESMYDEVRRHASTLAYTREVRIIKQAQYLIMVFMYQECRRWANLAATVFTPPAVPLLVPMPLQVPPVHNEDEAEAEAQHLAELQAHEHSDDEDDDEEEDEDEDVQ